MPKAKEKDLIIVESFAKTRTLSQFLGPNYDVRASLGHVRDLPKNKLGVDPANNFEPTYQPISDRADVIADLRKAVKQSRNVYLASDPDREGEAIAWHLQEVLGLVNPLRIEFNEITRTAVENALHHPRAISAPRVNAQQARRVLDRLVGYEISPLLWKKVAKNLSAGRVQSVAVRMVVEREREIQRFLTEEYWSLSARLTPQDREFPFEARLLQVAGSKPQLATAEQVAQVLAGLGAGLVRSEAEEWTAPQERPGPPWVVQDVKKRTQLRQPAPPFSTSTIQQEAARKLGFNARRTMSTAQQLYEGVDLQDRGHVGLITYMRTDSVQVSNEARAEAQRFTTERFGKEYLPETPRVYRSKKGAQEAHEAIRPTDVFLTPNELRNHLNNDQFRLYQLIWQRFLASQMAAAVFDVTSVDIAAGDTLFRATGRVNRFDGFMVLYTEGKDDRTAQDREEEEEEGRSIPPLQPGQALNLMELLPARHFTEPPPRFTEATLVKALEDKGIGRPSTYAAIMSTIVEREYVTLQDKRFKPTDLGCQVNDQLVTHFPDIVNEDFTALIEAQLDAVADGAEDWVTLLRRFYDPFQVALRRAETEMHRAPAEIVDQKCPLCGKDMAIRSSRFGKFLGCTGYPECRYTSQDIVSDSAKDLAASVGEEPATRILERYRSAPAGVVQQHARLGVLGAVAVRPVEEPSAASGDDAEAEEAMTCPECARPMVKKRGRFGEFWGCTGYPECKKIVDPKKKDLPPPDPDFLMPCPRPKCGGAITAKRSRRGIVFYSCSNFSAKPKCDYVAWSRPLPDQPCEVCGFPRADDVYRGKSKGLKCTNPVCESHGPKAATPARKPRAGAGKTSRPARVPAGRKPKAGS